MDHNGKQHRKKAGTRSWAETEEKKRKLEAQYEGKPATAEQEQQTIERAIELFLASKKAQGVDGQVVKKYERELQRLDAYHSGKSKLFVSEITLEGLTEYRANLGCAVPLFGHTAASADPPPWVFALSLRCSLARQHPLLVSHPHGRTAHTSVYGEGIPENSGHGDEGFRGQHEGYLTRRRREIDRKYNYQPIQ